jgi:hypothetical protein
MSAATSASHSPEPPIQALTGGRNAALDMIKWLALATMVIDHLRVLSPVLNWTYVPGRIAFPLFCLAMAINVGRLSPADIPSKRSNRYLGWLLAFAVISQPVFSAVMSSDLNIFFLLTIGYLHALGLRSGGKHGAVLIILGTALTAGMHGILGYGVAGVLLPSVMLLAHAAESSRSRFFWISTSVLLCVAANWPATLERFDEPRIAMAMLVAGSAPILGFYLLSKPIKPLLPPVTQWCYFFYPAHILLLGLIVSLK